MRTHNGQRPASNSLCACGDPDCIYSYQAGRFDRHAKRLEAIKAHERKKRPRNAANYTLKLSYGTGSWPDGRG